MPRLETVRQGSFLAAFALVLGACSFFSDFPDVVEQGAGGNPSSSSSGTPSSTATETPQSSGSTGDTSSSGSTSSSSPDVSSSSGSDGGGGGTGGSGECVPMLCQPCWDGQESCPDSERELRIFVNASTPDIDPREPNFPGSSVWINQIVVNAGETRYVGHAQFDDSGTRVDLPGDDIVTPAGSGVGFVLDEEGDIVTTAVSCTTDGGSSAEETFFFGGTKAEELFVVAGAYESGKLSFFGDASVDCDAAEPGRDIVSTHPTLNRITPFLAWIDEDGELSRGLTATEELEQAAYLSAVAHFADSGTPRVVAIGAGSGAVFGTSPVLPTHVFFLVSSDGVEPPSVLSLERAPCDGNHTVTLSGIKSGVAVDGDIVWAAGTGCAEGVGRQTDRGFISMVSTTSDLELDAVEARMLLGDDENPLSITDIAVSADLVVVAGTYTGLPDVGITIDEGNDRDGFVMAFLRDGWNENSAAVWFQRIAATDDSPVEVHDIGFDENGDVLVAGTFDTYLAISPVVTCTEVPEVDTKAFFTVLESDPELEGGRAKWVRIEGFEPGAGPAYAQGTAIAEREGSVLTATRSHGRMTHACDDVTGEGADGQGRVQPVTSVRATPAL